MDEKLKKDVEAVVAKIFSEKEDAEIRRQTEDALNKAAVTIDELTTSLEVSNTEVVDTAEKLSEAKNTIQSLETELEAAREKMEEANTKAEESESTLEEMKKDRAAELRVAELEEAGVISDKEVQSSKVRDMSDEEFASYKKELVSIRKAIIVELSKSDEKPVGGETSEEEEVAEEEESAEEEEYEAAEEEEGVPPAKVDPGQAVSAALNFEIFPSDDMVSKYQNMGKAMANLMIKKKND
jgi:chromosome segregation ATPase